MKFLFADESISQRFEFMVFCGFYYDVDDFKTLEDKLKQLCERFNIDLIEDIKLSNVTTETRKNVNKEIANLLKEKEAKIISVVTFNKHHITSYLEGIRLLGERFFKELRKLNDIGIILYDEDFSKKHIKKGITENGQLIKINNKTFIINVPMFVSKKDLTNKVRLLLFADNKECYSIQVASILSGAIEKAINNLYSDKGNLASTEIENLDKYFYGLKPYWSLFARNSSNKVNGWGVKLW